MSRRSSLYILVFVLALLPLSVYAQMIPIMVVQANATISVHYGPSRDQAVVGSLELGMPARIFSCNEDCSWLEMGPSVWIASSGVTLVGTPSALFPLPTATGIPAIAVAQIETPTLQPTSGVEVAIVVPLPTELSTAVPVQVQSISQPFVCIGGCAEAPDASCNIKGNVNSEGERIFHATESRSYGRTDIKPEEGDRWFCTSQEALNAGFREAQD